MCKNPLNPRLPNWRRNSLLSPNEPLEKFIDDYLICSNVPLRWQAKTCPPDYVIPEGTMYARARIKQINIIDGKYQVVFTIERVTGGPFEGWR